MKTDICAWCKEPQDEHVGLGVGCDEFIPIDWRATAHLVLDRIIDSTAKITAFASGDGDWLSYSFRLRAAVIRAQGER